MKVSALIELVAVVGLALPGVTVYRQWPDFIFAYCGAAMLALLGLAWLLSRGPKPNVP